MKKTPAKRGRGRPATGLTPKRYFRMDDEGWQQVADAATEKGETTSEYVRRVLMTNSASVLKRKS